ncbi:MAG: radical SAM protein [Deltaproteobacteria bacterium]|nr:radical SAM protein [Deltaproteobacteria bacterium]
MATIPRMAYADSTGQVFDHPRLTMAVFDGYRIREPLADELVPLPPGGDVFLLPGRLPLGFDRKGHLVEFAGDDDRLTAVSVFLPPAWLRLSHPAVRKLPEAPVLPLFAYAPVGWADGVFWTTALRIDPERRQDPALFDTNAIGQGVARDLHRFPGNRLMMQLRRCALDYGCRAAQNFFLKRWECPLPTATSCNARCVGCISHQDGAIPVTQERIDFHPSASEIAEVACLHFGRVEHPIASFGQGCEGEPLTRGKTLVEAVRLIRQRNPHHTVNLNTNASRPDVVEELLEVGLSSIRVSLSSPDEQHYNQYHRPQGYTLEDVKDSVRRARRRGRFVSLNLLVFPGLTDRETEVRRLEELIAELDVQMIQWRNMNIDPEYYLDTLDASEGGIGLAATVKQVRERFPQLRHGYFNPYVE